MEIVKSFHDWKYLLPIIPAALDRIFNPWKKGNDLTAYYQEIP